MYYIPVDLGWSDNAEKRFFQPDSSTIVELNKKHYPWELDVREVFALAEKQRESIYKDGEMIRNGGLTS